MIRQSCGKDAFREHSALRALSALSSGSLLLLASARFCRGLDELPGLPASDDARELEGSALRHCAALCGTALQKALLSLLAALPQPSASACSLAKWADVPVKSSERARCR